MKRLIALAFYCLSVIFVNANDGVFYAEGNQLIPITETDISVRMEVLTINRVGKHLEVTVYYEFFNPVGEKELLVGFETESPYNSRLDPIELYPKHPHINNFKVMVNGELLTYGIGCPDDRTIQRRLFCPQIVRFFPKISGGLHAIHPFPTEHPQEPALRLPRLYLQGQDVTRLFRVVLVVPP